MRNIGHTFATEGSAAGIYIRLQRQQFKPYNAWSAVIDAITVDFQSVESETYDQLR